MLFSRPRNDAATSSASRLHAKLTGEVTPGRSESLVLPRFPLGRPPPSPGTRTHPASSRAHADMDFSKCSATPPKLLLMSGFASVYPPVSASTTMRALSARRPAAPSAFLAPTVAKPTAEGVSNRLVSSTPSGRATIGLSNAAATD